MTFQAVFQRIRRRIGMIGAAVSLLWLLLAFALVLAVAAWCDLLWELSPDLRIGSMVVAALIATAVCARALWIHIAGPSRTAAVANRLDELLGGSGEIRVGVDLERQFPRARASSEKADVPLTPGLAHLAVDAAAERAAKASVAKAVPWKPIRRPSALIACFLIGLTLVALINPRLLATQWMRFTHPWADAPPYSSLTFSVDPGDAEVPYGGELEIRVSTSGPPIEAMNLILLPASSLSSSTSSQASGPPSEGDRVPMFREADGSWRTLLSSVTEPSGYYLSADRARSVRYKIRVLTVPRIEDMEIKITPPAYTGLPPYIGVLPSDGIVGLPGSKVEMTVQSNRPLSRVVLDFDPIDADATLQGRASAH